MKIDQIRVYSARLPFAFDFSHAQRKRAFANNVVVEVVAEDGTLSGFGEGAPRSYVTGETPATAAASVASAVASSDFCWDLSGPDQIRTWMVGLDRDRFGNAARCALELALLDLLGRRLRKPAIDFFPADNRIRAIFYGAALPLAPPDLIEKGARLVRELGIRRLKLKLGADMKKNRGMLETVAAVFNGDCEVKVDVNFAWDLSAAMAHIPLLSRHRVKVVEQPLVPEDPDRCTLAAAMAAEGIVLMADESACTMSDLKTICKENSFGMINMRLSKCGGFFRSLEMIDFLRGEGLSFQVACHLGESGILSAAGRTLGLLCGDAVYWDGSYDAFLLKENLTTEDVTFGPGGRAVSLPGPGLGVDVSRKALRRLTGGQAPVVFKRP